MGYTEAAFYLKLLADLVGLWMWGLCLWFCIVSIGAHWQVLWFNSRKHHIQFDMTWFSFVFPNTAMVTATQAVGKAFGSEAIKIVGTVMAGFLVIVWLFVFGMMVRSLGRKKLLWPEKILETSSPTNHQV